MANSEPSRTTLGPNFNEGARLLWEVMKARGWTQADLCRALDIKPGAQNRWLYGDRRPGRTWARKIHEQLGINPATWDASPTEHFVPPAARGARGRVAKPKATARAA